MMEFKGVDKLEIKYQLLATKIFEKGLKKKHVANTLGISPRALNNKIYGQAPFNWEEVCILQEKFFPDMSKDELFAATKAKDEQAASKEVS